MSLDTVPILTRLHGVVRLERSLTASRTLIAQFSEPIAKRYQLINASFEAYPHLDFTYDSLEDALSDATAWLGEQASFP